MLAINDTAFHKPIPVSPQERRRDGNGKPYGNGLG